MSSAYRWRGDVAMNATVEPYAAAAVLRVASAALAQEVRRLAAAGNRAECLQLLRAVQQMRKAGDQVAGSAAGTSEVPTAVGLTGSARPPETGTSVREVATELGLTTRRVRSLIGEGRLRGHLDKGQWVIAPESVAAEIQRRQEMDR